MGNTDNQTVGIVGAGRLGSTLALALAEAGAAPVAVASRTQRAAEALAARLGCEALPADVLVDRTQRVFLAAPDDALAELCSGLPWAAGHQAVHLSGALGLEVLQPVRDAGGLAGCLHPLQSFPERLGSPARFAGIHCGVEGDGELGDALARLCQRLGARALRLEGVDRAGYHLAAVFASNYVVALHAAAARAFELAGLPGERAREALAPLTSGAADNLQRLPLEQALTGPLIRGDVDTIRGHLEALRSAPELRALYCALGRQLLSRPLGLEAETVQKLHALLGA